MMTKAELIPVTFTRNGVFYEYSGEHMVKLADVLKVSCVVDRRRALGLVCFKVDTKTRNMQRLRDAGYNVELKG
jgi:hypothetical protein